MNSKYKNKKVVVDGFTFDSMKESKRYLELKNLLTYGQISDLKMQVKFDLVPPMRSPIVIGKRGGKKGGNVIKGYGGISYVADFTYYRDGQYIVEDVKGYKTDVYKLKKQLMYFVHGIVIKEV